LRFSQLGLSQDIKHKKEVNRSEIIKVFFIF
jgi:hypothetical protein